MISPHFLPHSPPFQLTLLMEDDHSRDICFIVILRFLIIKYCCRLQIYLKYKNSMIIVLYLFQTLLSLPNHPPYLSQSRIPHPMWIIFLSFLVHIVLGTNSDLGLIVSLHDHHDPEGQRATQSPLSLRQPYPPIYTLPIEFSQTSY